MTSEQTQPGWYPDPSDPARVRYWNGEQWSVETRPRYATPGPVVQPAAIPTATKPAGATAAAPTGKVVGVWRLLGGLIDVAICLPLGLLAAWPIVYKLGVAALEAQRNHQVAGIDSLLTSTELGLLILAGVLVWFFYGLFFTRYAGGTLGQWAVGARVVEADGSSPVSWAAAARRSLVRGMTATLFLAASSTLAMLVAWGILAISLAMIGQTAEGRSLFDVTGGTRVVRRR